MGIYGISHSSSYQRRKVVNLDENLAVTLGGGFFGRILIGYALKKIIKIVAIIAGLFLAAMAYLQYQQIVNINWDKLQTISEDTLTTLANATQQIPGFDGNGNTIDNDDDDDNDDDYDEDHDDGNEWFMQ